MSATSDFYRSQAEKCASDADASALPEVRERNLRAAAAWTSMADKLVLTETTRAKAAARKEAEAEARDAE
ncbi:MULTISPECIES: hypothetical protein [unclassified Sphingopyxis]|uniref:hypothetical protein n=1 Tax=unclassified Sphingopyxis TaxID=2614943 RepID=UPI0007376577|nr:MULTISPECIES: hypothetical protein [unclassified Sphingopyxis]KTE33240.1 hypothetical protein ATE62_17080 [Sphingopyxis sp. HIX]KTE79894.1 hypothetical protein ATE72_18440 [Sphingopyxis sp. HXXIV]